MTIVLRILLGLLVYIQKVGPTLLERVMDIPTLPPALREMVPVILIAHTIIVRKIRFSSSI